MGNKEKLDSILNSASILKFIKSQNSVTTLMIEDISVELKKSGENIYISYAATFPIKKEKLQEFNEVLSKIINLVNECIATDNIDLDILNKTF